MAIVHCPECMSDVSDSAMRCPSCGVQLRKPTRSFFGKLVKWTFIIFNLLMAWWLLGGIGSALEGVEAMSEAEQAGAAIGTGIGAFLILAIWAFGDLILGLLVLFTRPRG